MLRKSVVLVFLFLIAQGVIAQEKKVETQNLLWGRYLLNFRFSEKWTPFFDVEERVYASTLRQHHFLPSIGTRYKIDQNFTLTAAMMYFGLTLPQDPDANNKQVQDELRPQLSLSFKHNTGSNLIFLSRIKPELRYIRTPDAGSYRLRTLRLRMRMGIKYLINDKFDVKLLEEIHMNISNRIVRNVFDQNRFSAGINYKLNDQFQFEAGYLYWFQQSSSGDDFFSRNIVYFTIKQNLNFN